MHKKFSKSTSWQSSGKWYHQIVGKKGHYYHQTVVIPKTLKLLALKASQKDSLLDLAAGQGVLSRHLPKGIFYSGVDAAKDLILSASQYDRSSDHHFICADVTKKLPLEKKDFSHASIILALQNIETPAKVMENASFHLKEKGKLLIVVNHPCFRIPRQTSWQIDANSQTRFRRIDRYLSPLTIPIQTHPSQGKDSPQTWSFHHPLSSYFHWLKEAGFTILNLEEWCSDKKSEGKSSAAKMENRSRQEIPLFMAILAEKI